MCSNAIASSFTRAMLTSRWTFSTTFAASATSIDGARWTPASTIVSYSDATSSTTESSWPLTTFTTFRRS